MTTAGVLLAAGLSRRFGPADKLLSPWHGRPLVTAAASTLAQAGCDDLAAVVSSDAVAAALPPSFHIIRIAPGLPMAASFRAACHFAEDRGADRLLIALGDMPGVSAGTLRWLLDGTTSRACQHDGARMPPALLLRADWQAATPDGDQGARAILARLPPYALRDLQPPEAADVDTALDLQRWQSSDQATK